MIRTLHPFLSCVPRVNPTVQFPRNWTFPELAGLMWLRRRPKRTNSLGSTAFGSSSKRFDPQISIIDWYDIVIPHMPWYANSDTQTCTHTLMPSSENVCCMQGLP